MKENRQGFAVKQPDRRAYPRYSLDEDSVVLFMGHGMPLSGCIVDLSMDGCRVRTRELNSARPQSRVEVCFKLNEVSFRFSGVVEWADSCNTLGIRFVDMIPRRRVALAAVIDQMEAASAARAEAVNTLFPEQEAAVQAKGEAKESAEKQNRELAEHKAEELAAEQPAAQQAPAGTGQQSSEAGTRRDRRGQERHELDTFAKILLIKIGCELRGRILDLSLSGCRIRTDERFPVGVYTRVETEFCMDGLTFRLGGVIQAIHDRNVVGIRFLDLSERKRQQVAELICEIQQIYAAKMPIEPAAAEGRT